MSFIEPNGEYNVHLFQKDTLRLIGEIRERKKLPIIVGGTAYYIESGKFGFLTHVTIV
jgi:tRNA dimethylallyltransferase